MKCHEVKNKLSAYQDKQLSQDEMNQIASHLKSCQDCQEELHALNLTLHTLGEADKIETAPFFTTRVMQRIKEQEGKLSKPRRLFNPLELIPVPVLTVVVLIFGLLIGAYMGKTISNQSVMAEQTTQDQEIEQLFAINSIYEVTGESVPDVYISLISDNDQQR